MNYAVIIVYTDSSKGTSIVLFPDMESVENYLTLLNMDEIFMWYMVEILRRSQSEYVALHEKFKW